MKPKRYTCRRCAASIAPDSRHFPFCSERCRLIDLGKWMGGSYRVSRPLDPERDDAENGDEAE